MKKLTTPSLRKQNQPLQRAERPLNTTTVDQVVKMVASFWRHAALLARLQTTTHPAYSSVSLTLMFLDIVYSDDLKPEGPHCSNCLLYNLSERKRKASSHDNLWYWAAPLLFSKCTFPFIRHSACPRPITPYPCSLLLSSFNHMNSYVSLSTPQVY